MEMALFRVDLRMGDDSAFKMKETLTHAIVRMNPEDSVLATKVSGWPEACPVGCPDSLKDWPVSTFPAVEFWVPPIMFAFLNCDVRISVRSKMSVRIHLS
ncbi:hypothetical protein H671_5g14267 [Cricetulus griseus]|nr:hypothetical protein H671_5g14267 [Cricetulus griseus]